MKLDEVLNYFHIHFFPELNLLGSVISVQPSLQKKEKVSITYKGGRSRPKICFSIYHCGIQSSRLVVLEYVLEYIFLYSYSWLCIHTRLMLNLGTRT